MQLDFFSCTFHNAGYCVQATHKVIIFRCDDALKTWESLTAPFFSALLPSVKATHFDWIHKSHKVLSLYSHRKTFSIYPGHCCYYGGLFCIESFHFQAHQVSYFLFSGWVGLTVLWDHKAPREYCDCTACFEKITVIDRLSHSTKTIFETWTVGANFPSASTQRAGCRTQTCWATMDSWGKLKFSAGRERGESFKNLVHTSLCSQHGIFLIRAPTVSTHLLLSICMAGGFFNSTSKAKICKSFKQPVQTAGELQ